MKKTRLLHFLDFEFSPLSELLSIIDWKNLTSHSFVELLSTSPGQFKVRDASKRRGVALSEQICHSVFHRKYKHS